MRAPFLRMFVASSLILTLTPWPASAQFGLPRIGRVLHLPGPGRILNRGMHFGKFRRTFGARRILNSTQHDPFQEAAARGVRLREFR